MSKMVKAWWGVVVSLAMVENRLDGMRARWVGIRNGCNGGSGTIRKGNEQPVSRCSVMDKT